MAPILEKIMAGKEASPFILVKDTLEQSGQVLGLELLSNSPSEYVTFIAPIQRARLISSSIQRKGTNQQKLPFKCISHAIILVCAETAPDRLLPLVKGNQK